MAKSDNDKKTEFMQLPTAAIMPSGENPRIINEKDPRFVELAESVAAQGVMVPVHVRPKGKKYELLAGERRLRAANVAKRETLPAMVHYGMTDAELQAVATLFGQSLVLDPYFFQTCYYIQAFLPWGGRMAQEAIELLKLPD